MFFAVVVGLKKATSVKLEETRFHPSALFWHFFLDQCRASCLDLGRSKKGWARSEGKI